ncbi:MAG: hypothetical protein IJ876_02525 [Elusimicrobiaceae bacterium]|nr:hypothetical protein [Elusimicrobiaceae bacterium]
MEHPNFWQTILAGAIIFIKNTNDEEYQTIKNSPYIPEIYKQKLLFEKYMQKGLHDIKTMEDLHGLIESTKHK